MKSRSIAPASTPHPILTPGWLRAFRKQLTAWYSHAARPLPWRLTRDPYAIWISEIMLQQTTVAAVIPYFERFLARFPTLADLASAPEADVLRLWEGLGYYSRARNLHRAAQTLIADHAGTFPQTPAALQALPGIGRYTAGAIAAFAFDARAPIVEANTLRLYSRLLGYREDPRSSVGQEILWSFAESVLPRTAPGRFNQALMELGSQICSPDRPRCEVCPVETLCQARALEAVHLIPVPKPRPAITEVEEYAIAIRKGGAYLLMQRRPGERWAGLWDFIRFAESALNPSGAESASAREAETPSRGRLFADPLAAPLAAVVRDMTGLECKVDPEFMVVHHGVTRYRIRLSCHQAEWVAGRLRHDGRQLAWVAPERFVEYPLSVAARRLARALLSL